MPKRPTVIKMENCSPKLIGSIGTQKGEQAQMALRLAREHEVQPEQVAHCLDGVPHPVFGRNKRFVILNEPGKADEPLLAKLHSKGNIEIIPHKYIGSALHPLSKPDKPRYVHFYILPKGKAKEKLLPPDLSKE